MSNEFTEKYFEPCVKNFISTVLLIDDQLEYSEPKPIPFHEEGKLVIPEQGSTQVPTCDAKVLLSASSNNSAVNRNVYVTDLIKSFSKEGLLVTPINPRTIGAINCKDCISILFDLAKKADVIILDWEMNIVFPGGRKLATDKLSRNLIKKLNEDRKYRLIIIYTAGKEEDVKIPSQGNLDIRKYGKNPITSTASKNYDELAKQITKDYLYDRSGIFCLTLLTSLSEIRKSTHSILNTLNKKFDIALLYHRILLTEPNKTVDFCSDVIADEILSHISPEVVKSCLTEECFKNYIIENKINLLFKKDENTKRWEIKESEIDNLLKKGYKSFFNKDISDLIAKGKHLDYIVKESDSAKLKEFSYYSLMLSHEISPNLKLGCIVKYKDNFFLCVQPLCDAERIPKKEDIPNKFPSNFIFLRLNKNSKMDLLIKEGTNYITLKIDYSNIITLPVLGDDNGVVGLHNGKYKLFNKRSLVYIDCLKPMIAQKIANNFAANISRVGIDQFEWLRLKGRK